MQHSGKSLSHIGAMIGTVVQAYAGIKTKHIAVTVACNGKWTIVGVHFAPA